MGANWVAERQSTGLGVGDVGSCPGCVITLGENLSRSPLFLCLSYKNLGAGRPDDPSSSAADTAVVV